MAGIEKSYEIRKALASIHRFMEPSQFEKVKFLTSGILNDGKVQKTCNIAEVYELLKSKYTQAQICCLLRYILTTANVNSVYIEELPSFDSSVEFKEEGFPDLSFYEMLIQVTDSLGDKWRSLAVVLTDNERGVATANIYSGIHLFQCLIRRDTISSDREDKSREFLAHRLAKAGHNDIARKLSPQSRKFVIERKINDGKTPSSAIVRSGRDGSHSEAVTPNERTALLPKPPLERQDGPIIDDDDSLGRAAIKVPRASLRVRVCFLVSLSCVIAIGVCLFVSLVSLTSVYAEIHKDYSSSRIMHQNWTILTTNAGIDTRYYSKVRLTLSTDYPHDIEMCQIECPTGYPSGNQLVNSSLHLNDDEGVSEKYSRYFARFRLPDTGRQEAANVGVYLLRGSSISITLLANNLSINLYLFNNSDACDTFFVGGKLDKSHVVTSWSFNNGSGSEAFTVIPADGFYCALWDVQSPRNTPFSLNYTSNISVVSFNIAEYHNKGQCSTLTSSDETVHDKRVEIRLQRKGTLKVKSPMICLILSQSLVNNRRMSINVTVQSAGSDNYKFKLSIIGLGCPTLVFVFICKILLLVYVFKRARHASVS